MAKKKKPIDRPVLPPLAAFLRRELSRRNMTQTELEQRAGVPDATLSRIMSGEVAEPKGSQVALIAHGLNMKFWELAAVMGISDAEPGSPEQEAEQIAALVAGDPELRQVMHRVMRYAPKNRAAVLAYMRMLESQADPQAPEAE